MFSYLVQHYGDKGLVHLNGVLPVHIVAEYAVICSKSQPDDDPMEQNTDEYFAKFGSKVICLYLILLFNTMGCRILKLK